VNGVNGLRGIEVLLHVHRAAAALIKRVESLLRMNRPLALNGVTCRCRISWPLRLTRNRDINDRRH